MHEFPSPSSTSITTQKINLIYRNAWHILGDGRDFLMHMVFLSKKCSRWLFPLLKHYPWDFPQENLNAVRRSKQAGCTAEVVQKSSPDLRSCGTTHVLTLIVVNFYDERYTDDFFNRNMVVCSSKASRLAYVA